MRQNPLRSKVNCSSLGVLVKVLRTNELTGIECEKPRMATMLEGKIEFQTKGKEKKILKAGDTFYEPKMILHLVGRNPCFNEKIWVLATIVHPTDTK